ncbi:hypothetical protein BH09BAC1_BH09BAC1_11480 [soil metagenome]
MTQQILDTTENLNLRKPISWWLAGLLGGIACLVLFVTLMFTAASTGIFGDMPRGGKNTGLLFFIMLFISMLPMFIAVGRVAMYGRYYRHFQQVQITGALACTIIAFSIITVYFYIQEYTSMDTIEAIWPVIIALYAFTSIISSLLWLVLGNWKKYRNQVIRY